MNVIGVIAPYKFEGLWVFDDPAVGLRREAFVAGIDQMIDQLVAPIPNAERGFRLIFSATAFPGHTVKLEWRREESGGNWYYCPQFGIEGWLCPALFRYFEKTPAELFARAEPQNTGLPGSGSDREWPTSAIDGYCLIRPEDLSWRPSNLMKIPNADFLERTRSELLGARLWRLPPGSANTLHKHVRAEEFYFVVLGTGRMRIGDRTLTVPEHGGVLVGPSQLRQVFNDTDKDVLWLIVGAPEENDLVSGPKPDMSLFYPVDPKQLPKELAGVEWPPKS